MAEEAVGSYPYEEWASEVRNALLGKGVDAEVSYAGPRAYPVLIDERDSEKAQGILADLGYFTCSNGRASLSGVLDWLPREAVDDEELRDELVKALSEKIQEMANMSAAMTWSTPTDDLPDRYEDPWFIADFDGQIAVNGDPVFGGDVPSPPRGYVFYHGGGRVPCTEEQVSMEHALRAVKMVFHKYPPEIVKALLEDIWEKEYEGEKEIYTSVSGETEIYAKEKEEHGE